MKSQDVRVDRFLKDKAEKCVTPLKWPSQWERLFILERRSGVQLTLRILKKPFLTVQNRSFLFRFDREEKINYS